MSGRLCSRLLNRMMVVALRSERSDLIGRRADNFPSVQRGDEGGCPLACRDTWPGFPVVVDGDRIGCTGDRDEARVGVVDKHVSSALENGGVDIRGLSIFLGHSFCGESLGADLMSKINRRTEQGAKIAYRALRISQMLPGCFDDVGKQFCLRLRFSHEFENQKLTKTQTQQALEIRWELSWLSLLILREQILIYSSVCHRDTRRAK